MNPQPSDALLALVEMLRGGNWNLRAPQELADIIADQLEALATTLPPPETDAGMVRDAWLMQILHDPENQPSQYGTIPLFMIPERMDEDTTFDPFPVCEPDYDDGYTRGWNGCLEAIAAQKEPK